MANLPLEDGLGQDFGVQVKLDELRELNERGDLEEALDDKNQPNLKRAQKWGRSYRGSDSNGEALDEKLGKDRPMLPICPYGCGREGTLLELIMGTDGRALGIFNDHPCTCVFVADLQMGEPPKPRKLEIGPDGEYHEVEG